MTLENRNEKINRFFSKISNISAYIAEFLRNSQFHEKYYCFVPDKKKPKYLHKSYKAARQEAERLLKLGDVYTVEILQVVNRFESDEIPF